MQSKRFVLMLAALLGLLAGTPAFAITEECPTWFPDFQCDRSGRFDGFVTPITQPYLFEDPFITTGIQAVGKWHDYPQHSSFSGGHAWAMALQARVALTDRLAFIATKDGYVWSRPGNSALNNGDGFVNVAGGFKYALYQDREAGFILTPRVVIEAPVGNNAVYSGYGDGIAITGISSGWRTSGLNILGDIAMQVPFNREKQTTSLHYHLHLSYTLFKHFVPVFEMHGIHYTDDGNGKLKLRVRGTSPDPSLKDLGPLGTGFEGYDVANLGNKFVKGNDIVSLAVGARIPLTDHMSLGAAYEFPVTSRKDITNQRVTWSFVLEY